MSERPWIEWNGGPCPVARGVKVDRRYDDGFVAYGVPVGLVRWGGAGGAWVPDRAWEFPWLWQFPASFIIAYRLSEAPQAELDRISARQDMFRKIAEEAVKTDRPVRAPKKVGA